jgi:hypothetical protein
MVSATLFMVSFVFFGYFTYIKKERFNNVVNTIRQIEINLFELTTMTKRMLLEVDEDMHTRIVQNKKELITYINELKYDKSIVPQKETTELKEEVYRLFYLIDDLVRIKEYKKSLMKNIRQRMADIDTLLQDKETQVLSSKPSDIRVNLAFYSIDMILSKLARELGIYLKTDSVSAMKHIWVLFKELEKKKKDFESLSLDNKQYKDYQILLKSMKSKNDDIKKIIEMHQKKVATLKKLGQQTDRINILIDTNMHYILQSEKEKIGKIILLFIFLAILMFTMISLFFISSKNFLKKLSLILEDGFGKILKATQQISENKPMETLSFEE